MKKYIQTINKNDAICYLYSFNFLFLLERSNLLYCFVLNKTERIEIYLNNTQINLN